MSLRGFSTINFWADDVPAAVAWYTEFLGVEAYFMRPGPDGGPATEPGGAIMHWHVDDLKATVERLLSMGAKEYAPITPRGEGFVTASVVDPFGNVLGVMTNPHYLDVLKSTRPA